MESVEFRAGLLMKKGDELWRKKITEYGRHYFSRL